MPKYREDDMQEAIKAVGTGVSINKAAKDCHVPRSTLRDRLKGCQKKGLYEARVLQKLSMEEEDHIVKWVIIQEQLGQSVTQAQIRDVAIRLLKAGGSQQTIGDHWIRRFLRRHPELVKAKRPKSTDTERAEGPTGV